MSNVMFMFLFPQERNIVEAVIDKICDKKKAKDVRDLLHAYEERYGKSLPETVQRLREENPEKVASVIKQIAQNYNTSLGEATKLFPLTVDAYWQGYRRALGKTSLTEFPSEEDPDSDKRMADNCKKSLVAMMKSFGERAKTPLKNQLDLQREPNYVLSDMKPSFVPGLEVYCFETGKRKIATLWDLRQKEVPRLHYKPSK